MNLQAETNLSISPRVDIYENEAQYLLITDLPGVQSTDLKVSYEKEHLELAAVNEESQVHFLRRFHVADVDHESITAKLTNGVLTLELPKALPALAREVPIQAS